MIKRLFLCIISLMLIFSFSFAAFAHPGGTDANGGHYNRSTGEYHYHHGKSEHQHFNGECPYDTKTIVEPSKKQLNYIFIIIAIIIWVCVFLIFLKQDCLEEAFSIAFMTLITPVIISAASLTFIIPICDICSKPSNSNDKNIFGITAIASMFSAGIQIILSQQILGFVRKLDFWVELIPLAFIIGCVMYLIAKLIYIAAKKIKAIQNYTYYTFKDKIANYSIALVLGVVASFFI